LFEALFIFLRYMMEVCPPHEVKEDYLPSESRHNLGAIANRISLFAGFMPSLK